VLNSLRNGGWTNRLNAEKAEAERLNTAIAATWSALVEKQRLKLIIKYFKLIKFKRIARGGESSKNVGKAIGQ